MKNTRKLLAAVMALTMVSAIAPLSAFAITEKDIDPDTGKATGTMTATYDVQAKYTVTIPAGVELKSVGEGSVNKDITADDVMLESGKQIVVKLTGATNTTEGSTFHAKAMAAGSSSVATYTISKGETPVSVGDTVATFTSKTDKQSETLTFSEASGATDAGKHTETLTFGVAVEDAAKYNVHVSASYSVDSMFEGEPDQIGLTGAMEPVTVRIPDDYKTIFRFNKFDDIVQNGITKHWVDDYTVTVSGTPTADTNVFVRLDMID